jgi:hypothetical protein
MRLVRMERQRPGRGGRGQLIRPRSCGVAWPAGLRERSGGFASAGFACCFPGTASNRAVRAWLWMPASQPPGAGADRVGPHIFQLGWEAFGSADTCQWIEKLGKGFSARLGGVSYIHIKNK